MVWPQKSIGSTKMTQMEVHEAKPTQMLAARRMEQKKKPFLKKTFTRAMPFVDQIVAGKITEKYFFYIFHVFYVYFSCLF